MREKPAFKDYIRGIRRLSTFRNFIKSGGRLFVLRDYPMAVLCEILLILAVIFIFLFSPYSSNYRPRGPGNYRLSALAVCAAFIFLLSALYWLVFVYRFGRFAVKWQNSFLGLPGGEEKELHEERKQARISRVAFAVLAACIAALTAAYGVFGFGMAHIRFYKAHKEDLEKLAGIYMRCECLYMFDTDLKGEEPQYLASAAPGEDWAPLPEAEGRKITAIVDGLEGNYISLMFRDREDGEFFLMRFSAAIGTHRYLARYPGEESAARAASDFGLPEAALKRLDAYWWAFDAAPQEFIESHPLL